MKLTILLVEDDDSKAQRVRELLGDALTPESFEMRRERTVADAAQRMVSEAFDLLLLDLRIPRRRGEDARADGGISLLQELERVGRYNVPEHMVGLTGYRELANEQAPTFKSRLLPLVEFNPGTDEWVVALSRRIGEIIAARCGLTRAGFKNDLAIITALTRVEMESVLNLPVKWTQHAPDDDCSFYYKSTWRRGRAKVKVIATSVSEVGMPAAAAVTMKVIEIFRPRVVAMCGIAAGVEGSFGDILIAERCWDYGSGKVADSSDSSGAFLPAPTQIPVHPWLKTRLSSFMIDERVCQGIREGWTGDAPREAPRPRFGPLASGASVVSRRAVVDDLKKRDMKVIGLEMEAYGVFVAAQNAREPRPLPLVIKSLCDFGDSNKADKFQRYAAYTSSRFLYEFALKELSSGQGADGG
jgi:nucleoside phosphorylase